MIELYFHKDILEPIFPWALKLIPSALYYVDMNYERENGKSRKRKEGVISMNIFMI